MVRARICLWLVVGALVCAGAVAAQEAQNPDSKKTTTTESKKKAALTDAVRVSTETAVSSAAKKEAQKAGLDKAAEAPPDASVLELRPAAEAAGSGGAAAPAKSPKKAPLKDVHGTVYGSSDVKNSGTRRAGGAVGASSKSGKASVYVETDRSRTTPPP
jgi:hypothetical protein